MSRRLKIIVVSVASTVVLIVVVAVLLYETIFRLSTRYDRVEIRSENLKESIYIKRETWGLVGSGQIVVISTSPKLRFEPDSTKDYIWSGFDRFLYKFENDTLYVYPHQRSPVPDNWTSRIAVHQLHWTTGLRDSMEVKGLKLP